MRNVESFTKNIFSDPNKYGLENILEVIDTCMYVCMYVWTDPSIDGCHSRTDHKSAQEIPRL